MPFFVIPSHRCLLQFTIDIIRRSPPPMRTGRHLSPYLGVTSPSALFGASPISPVAPAGSLPFGRGKHRQQQWHRRRFLVVEWCWYWSFRYCNGQFRLCTTPSLNVVILLNVVALSGWQSIQRRRRHTSRRRSDSGTSKTTHQSLNPTP